SDREDRCSRTHAVAAGGQANSQTTTIREPLQCVVDAGCVDRTDTDTTNCCADVEAHQRGGLRVQNPCATDADGAEGDHDAGAEFIDEEASNRSEPGLNQDEDGE